MGSGVSTISSSFQLVQSLSKESKEELKTQINLFFQVQNENEVENFLFHGKKIQEILSSGIIIEGEEQISNNVTNDEQSISFKNLGDDFLKEEMKRVYCMYKKDNVVPLEWKSKMIDGSLLSSDECLTECLVEFVDVLLNNAKVQEIKNESEEIRAPSNNEKEGSTPDTDNLVEFYKKMSSEERKEYAEQVLQEAIKEDKRKNKAVGGAATDYSQSFSGSKADTDTEKEFGK